ncbi:MAG: hypothetical protein R2857_00545 [Vampirovibrionales bacterium]
MRRLTYGRFIGAVPHAFTYLRQRLGQGEPILGVNLRMSQQTPRTGRRLRRCIEQLGRNVGRIVSDRRIRQCCDAFGVDLMQRSVDHVAPVARQIPVYAGVGNNGPGSFNLIGADASVIQVGYTDAQGQVSPYSGMGPLVNEMAQGDIAVTEVYDEAGQLKGYDITGNGQVNITPDEVSGGPCVVKRFVGRPQDGAGNRQ